MCCLLRIAVSFSVPFTLTFRGCVRAIYTSSVTSLDLLEQKKEVLHLNMCACIAAIRKASNFHHIGALFSHS